ncbi:uncharacterized protein LOC127131663 [Lathyrus oleraceus]|uniref:uncharacterized protein LOC127131663 n=1 Tax=Pisum sativum TaxID=3888 RepID=UPI0021D19826|nr:uncharacterized protein LOC127131663 [Pisum sativum]
MKRNGIDLTEELRMQGWETYFQRLYGPVYTYLVKEFWRFADADDHYIVSYVLGVKMVITEKSIASLLNMEKTGGRRIYSINPREKYLSQDIGPTIFQQNAEEATIPPPEQQNPPPFEQPQTPPPEQPATPPFEQQPSPPPEQTTTSPSDIPTIPPSEYIIITTPQTPTDATQTPPSSTSPNQEPEPAFPTLEEAITLFAESLMEKIKSLYVNSGINDDPSIVRIH